MFYLAMTVERYTHQCAVHVWILSFQDILNGIIFRHSIFDLVSNVPKKNSVDNIFVVLYGFFFMHMHARGLLALYD